MGELRPVLDALAADELTPMFGQQLLERLAPLLQAHSALLAEITRTVRECEKTGAAEHDGLRTMQSWLRGHGRWSKNSAAQLVANGRALEHLPAVATGFAAGMITADQVAVAAQVATPARLARAAEQGVDVHGFDEALAEAAINSPARLPEVVQLVLAALDPDGPEPDPTEGRRLTIAKHADGSMSGRFDLDAVGGEKVQAALESIVQAARPRGDTRTRAQQNADAFVQLCDNQLAGGDLPFLRGEKPHLVVTIGIDDLLDPSTGPNAAETGFGATISAAAARWAACDAKVSRMVLDPDGLPLDVGRSKRLVPAHIRRAVERRDRHCVFAGCSAPTHWCDVHHQLEWLRDHGDTSLENSALLCERHHTKVHHGFRVERPPDGRWRTYRPDGTQILIGPPLQV